MLKYLNLSLLILFPIAWFAPVLRAGILPLFGLSEISILSGLQSLWATDVFLALVVTTAAIFAPTLKILGMILLQFGLADARIAPALSILGKLAMADIFLIALYVVVIKGIGIGKVEIAWGLYLFTFCIILSMVIQILESRKS